MSNPTHLEFIQKFSLAKQVRDFHRSEPRNGFSDAALQFRVLPITAASRVRYCEAHRRDPQCPWLANFRHKKVCEIASLVRLNNVTEMREDLIKHFQYSTNGSFHHWPKLANRPLVRKLMTASGLKWYDRGGNPTVHWNEKA